MPLAPDDPIDVPDLEQERRLRAIEAGRQRQRAAWEARRRGGG